MPLTHVKIAALNILTLLVSGSTTFGQTATQPATKAYDPADAVGRNIVITCPDAPHPELDKANQRLTNIKEELADISEHDWAGGYGAFLFSVLEISPNAGVM